VRIDSTVIEADIKHPTDAGLACRMTQATRGADETPAFRARQGWRDTRDRFCIALEGRQGRERWPRPPPYSWLP